MGYRVAVVGATGNVGREMLDDPRRAVVSRRRGGRARLAPQPGQRGQLRRQDAQGQSARALRLLRRRHLPDVGGLGRVEGMVAEDRGGRRGRDRQFLVLALRRRRSAGRAGGQRRRGRGLPQEGHHRQSELLDRAARGRAQAAARQGQDHARGGRDLSIGLGRRQGGDGRAVRADQVGLRARRDHAEEVPQAHRLQRDPAYRRVPWTTGSPGKSGRWWSRPRRSSTPRSRSSPPACACRSSSAIRRPSTSSSRIRSRRTRRATSCATRRA